MIKWLVRCAGDGYDLLIGNAGDDELYGGADDFVF